MNYSRFLNGSVNAAIICLEMGKIKSLMLYFSCKVELCKSTGCKMLKRWIMGHRAYGASSSCSVRRFPPNPSCAAFSLVSSVKKKKKSGFCLCFVFFFICTFVHTRLKSHPTSEANSWAAKPSHTSVSLSEQTPAWTSHTLMWPAFESINKRNWEVGLHE